MSVNTSVTKPNKFSVSMIVDSDELTWSEAGSAVTVFTILVSALIIVALAKLAAVIGATKMLGDLAIAILVWLGIIKTKNKIIWRWDMKKKLTIIYFVLLIVFGTLYLKDRGFPSFIKKMHLFNAHQLVTSSSYAEFTADIYQIDDEVLIEVYSDRKDLRHRKTSLSGFDYSLTKNNIDIVWEESQLLGVRMDDSLLLVPEDLLDDSNEDDSSEILSNERVVAIKILEKLPEESKELYSESFPQITFFPAF